jgi:hypothetical protein
MKLRLVLTCEYEVDAGCYPEGSSHDDMARVERDNFLEDPSGYIADVLDCGPGNVVVEVASP